LRSGCIHFGTAGASAPGSAGWDLQSGRLFAAFSLRGGRRLSHGQRCLRFPIRGFTIQVPLGQQTATPSGKVAAVAEQASPHSWSVEIYQTLDRDRQQRILEVFRDIERPKVTALGTQSENHWFVIVEVRSIEDRTFASRTIRVIDPRAARTYSSGRPQLAGSLPPSYRPGHDDHRRTVPRLRRLRQTFRHLVGRPHVRRPGVSDDHDNVQVPSRHEEAKRDRRSKSSRDNRARRLTCFADVVNRTV
jgi:hypothetical protein